MLTTTGLVDTHFRESHGGESYPMKFYCTQNEATYGQHWADDFVPRIGVHKGAGFVPNNRPFLAYRPGPADPDHARMGPLLASNYLTMTHKDYIGHTYPKGNETLPQASIIGHTGFIREKGVHNPTSGQGKFNPSTQYNDCYKEWPKFSGPFSAGGTKTPSGYTSNNSLHEPVTFNGTTNHSNARPGWMTHRPIGNTLYNTSFRPMKYPHGAEPLPELVHRSALDSGFTTGNPQTGNRPIKHPVYDLASKMSPAKLEKLKKGDPVEYINATNPSWDPTVYKGQYQPPLSINNERLDTTGAVPGDSGFTNNMLSWPAWIRDAPDRFVTHTMTAFHDPTSVNIDRQGHLGFDVEPICPDGFSKSTMLSKIEPQVDSFKMLRRLNPYQARSINAREYVTTAPTKNMVFSY